MVGETLKKTNTILLFCFLIIAGLYFGATFLIPLTFAVFLSTLVLPISNFLEIKMGLGRITSSFICTFVLFIGVGLILFFLFRQLSIFLSDLLERKDDILAFISVLQERITSSTGITLAEQEEMFKNNITGLLQRVQKFLSGILTDLTSAVLKFMLVLIYVFLILLNRNKFVMFIMKYIKDEKKEETRKILNKTKKVAYRYLWGRIQVMVILAIMYTITFFAYDLKYAALLIIFGVIITIIPYLGPFLSGLLPILFMIIFGGSPLEIISFTILVIIIQLIESYVLEPVIIGSEIQQSPLFVIIAIVLGGFIWGAAGLILFVPIFAILKILFDHSNELKPVGFLIGYQRPGSGEDFYEKIKKRFRK